MAESLSRHLGCRHLESESYNHSTSGALEGTVNMGGAASGCTSTWTPYYLL
jgi:hypothetical protein